MTDGRKKYIGTVIELSLVLLALVFSIVAFVGKSAAWFANNKSGAADGMGVALLAEDGLGMESVSVYKVDEDNNSATLHREPTQEELAHLLTLNQYDSVFAEKRGNIPIILKASLSGFSHTVAEAATFSVTVSLGTPTGYTVTGEDDRPLLSGYISNLLNIRCSVDPGLANDTLSPADYYSFAKEYFTDAGNIAAGRVVSHTFVDYTLNGEGVVTAIGADKAEALTFTLTKPAGQATVDLYLYINYDENLIARFIADNNRRTGSVDELEDYFVWGAEVVFVKDIAKITVQEAE